MKHMVSLVAVGFLLIGCGGGGLDLADRDPRCISSCTDTPPRIEGAFDVCNEASQISCLDECEARIASTTTVCSNCLLENSDFSPPGSDGGSTVSCTQATCTITGRVGSCSYPVNDQAGEDRCLKQVYPRREVACQVDWRSTTGCASVCTAM